MKYSQFNTLIPFEEKYVFHNSLSNKFLYLEPLLKELIVASKRENKVKELEEIHPDLYKNLVNFGFIVEKKQMKYKK